MADPREARLASTQGKTTATTTTTQQPQNQQQLFTDKQKLLATYLANPGTFKDSFKKLLENRTTTEAAPTTNPEIPPPANSAGTLNLCNNGGRINGSAVSYSDLDDDDFAEVTVIGNQSFTTTTTTPTKQQQDHHLVKRELVNKTNKSITADHQIRETIIKQPMSFSDSPQRQPQTSAQQDRSPLSSSPSTSTTPTTSSQASQHQITGGVRIKIRPKRKDIMQQQQLRQQQQKQEEQSQSTNNLQPETPKSPVRVSTPKPEQFTTPEPAQSPQPPKRARLELGYSPRNFWVKDLDSSLNTEKSTPNPQPQKPNQLPQVQLKAEPSTRQQPQPSKPQPQTPPSRTQKQSATFQSPSPSSQSNSSSCRTKSETMTPIRINGHLVQDPGSPVTPSFYSTPDSKRRRESKATSSDEALIPFSWNLYLEYMPEALIAPKEAFYQPIEPPLANKFALGMFLIAKDPKKSDEGESSWALARIVAILSKTRIKLRFEGNDAMNDVYASTYSKNIEPYGDAHVLYPPVGFKGNIASYPKFVDRAIARAISQNKIAPRDCFHPEPQMPPLNMFRKGMKIEAIDRKNVHAIYPATIGKVSGDEVQIVFDGWKGSFDYHCKYYSQEIFPINFCNETEHKIYPPKNWNILLQSKPVLQQPGTTVNGTSLPTVSQAENSTFTKQSTSDKSQSTSSSVSKKNNTPSVENPSKRGRKRKSYTPSRVVLAPEDDSESGHVEMGGSSTNDDNDNLLDSSESTLPTSCQRTMSYQEYILMKNKKQSKHVIDINNPPLEGSYTVDSSISTQADELNSSFVSDSTSLKSNISKLNRSCSNQSNGSTSSPMQEEKSRPEEGAANNIIQHNDDSFRDTNPHTTFNFRSKSVNDWTVEDVIAYIRDKDDSLSKYSDLFSENEIDGRAFTLLTEKTLSDCLGLKVGPMLKILSYIKMAKEDYKPR